MVFLELSAEAKEDCLPFWMAETSSSMQLFYKYSIGSSSPSESPCSHLGSLKMHFPKNLIGKENTPKVRQQISLSSPTFFGWKVTSTLVEVFGAILIRFGLKEQLAEFQNSMAVCLVEKFSILRVFLLRRCRAHSLKLRQVGLTPILGTMETPLSWRSRCWSSWLRQARSEQFHSFSKLTCACLPRMQLQNSCRSDYSYFARMAAFRRKEEYGSSSPWEGENCTSFQLSSLPSCSGVARLSDSSPFTPFLRATRNSHFSGVLLTRNMETWLLQPPNKGSIAIFSIRLPISSLIMRLYSQKLATNQKVEQPTVFGSSSMLPSTVPLAEDCSVSLMDFVSLGWRVKDSLDMLSLAALSASKGMSLTLTEFSPQLVIAQLASIVLPVFAKPMFRNGSNCSLATCGKTLIGTSTSEKSVRMAILSLMGWFSLLSQTTVTLRSRPAASGPSLERWTARKGEAGLLSLILRLFCVTFLIWKLISQSSLISVLRKLTSACESWMTWSFGPPSSDLHLLDSLSVEVFILKGSLFIRNGISIIQIRGTDKPIQPPQMNKEQSMGRPQNGNGNSQTSLRLASLPDWCHYYLQIYLFGMSLKRESPCLVRRNSLDKLLCCEACATTEHDIFVCKSCLAFCCRQCSEKRECPLEGTQCCFERVDSEVISQLQSHKRMSQTSKSRFYESSNRIQAARSCQRCFISSAAKECRSCKVRNLCDSCFQAIHSKKLADHQSVDIRQCREKNMVNEKIEVKVKARPFNSTINLLTKEKELQNQREEELSVLENNLNFLKNSLLQERTRQQNDVTHCINSVSSLLEALIEEAKLKIVQISLKIRECNAEGEVFYQERKEMLAQQERCLDNLKAMAKQPSSVLANQVIEEKIKSCSKVISQYIFNQQWALNFNKDNMEKRCVQLAEDIGQVKTRIAKLDLRKTNYLLETPKNNTMGNATSRQSKSDIKSMKSSLNCNSSKPNDKPNSLTMSLFTPKNGSNVPRASKDSQSGLGKSLYSSQTGAETSEDYIIECFQGSSSKKNIEKPLEFGSEKKQLKLPLVSPKTSVKRFDRNPEKVNIAKAGNAEKNKKTLKDIRSQMRQLTTRLNSETMDPSSQKRSEASLGRNSSKKL